MADKPIGVLYQECSEGEADAEHTYYHKVICGNCSEPIGTTLQEKLCEEVIQCPKCKCTLDYQKNESKHDGVMQPVLSKVGGTHVNNKVLNPWDSAFYTEAKAVLSIDEAYKQLESIFSKKTFETNDLLSYFDIIDRVGDNADLVEHHGVKGMRWGVRRSPEELGHDISKRLSDFQREEVAAVLITSSNRAAKSKEENKQLLREIQEKVRKADDDLEKADDNFQSSLKSLNTELRKRKINERYFGELSHADLTSMGLESQSKARDTAYKEYRKAYTARAKVMDDGIEKLVPTLTERQIKKYNVEAVGKRNLRKATVRTLANYGAGIAFATATAAAVPMIMKKASIISGSYDGKAFDYIEHDSKKTIPDRMGGTHVNNKVLNPWDSSFYDEIEHYGVKGMKWGVRKDKIKSSRESDDNDAISKKELLRQRKADNDMINKKMSRLSSMTPEEADAFIAQLKRMNTATRLNEERLRAISQTQLAEIQLQKARLETINTGLSGVKTSMEVANKVSRTKVAKKAAQELGKRSTKKGS